MNKKGKEDLCNSLIKKLKKIIRDDISDKSPITIKIDKHIELTSGNKTWIIASDPVYSQLYDYYEDQVNYNLIKSKLIISNSTYQYIKDKGLTFYRPDNKAQARQYLNDLSKELNQCICNESTNCDELNKIGYFDFIKLVKEHVDELKPGNFSHIKMDVDNSSLALRFSENQNGSYSPLTFINRDQTDIQVDSSNRVIYANIAPQIQYISKSMRDIQRRVGRYQNEDYFKNSVRSTESFYSINETFAYLNWLPDEKRIKQYYRYKLCPNYKDDSEHSLKIKGFPVEEMKNLTLQRYISYEQNNTENLPRICNDRLTASEDSNNSSIAIILVQVFAIFAIVAILAAYCKSHHQRRNSNRNPGISTTANRRGSETLEVGDGQQQLEEREHLSIQEAEAEQQLDSGNGASEIGDGNNGQQLASNEGSELSSNSDTSSYTSSSRSGTISRARSSTSMEESEHSDPEEVITEGSQRSQSPTSIPQKPPRTLAQNMERMNARSGSSRPSISSQLVGCFRNSCS